MSAAKERVDQVRKEIQAVLGSAASPTFFTRVEAVLGDWSEGKINAAQACEKIQKMVSLFIDEDKAKEIGNRCAPIVMRDGVK